MASVKIPICVSCGTDLARRQDHCPSCGAAVSSLASRRRDLLADPQRRLAEIGVVIVAVVFVGAVALWTQLGSDDPERVQLSTPTSTTTEPGTATSAEVASEAVPLPVTDTGGTDGPEVDSGSPVVPGSTVAAGSSTTTPGATTSTSPTSSTSRSRAGTATTVTTPITGAPGGEPFGTAPTTTNDAPPTASTAAPTTTDRDSGTPPVPATTTTAAPATTAAPGTTHAPTTSTTTTTTVAPTTTEAPTTTAAPTTTTTDPPPTTVAPPTTI